MLSIGRALMTNPDCLVLDEATEGLAPKIVREIWHVIETVRATGIASVVVDRNYRSRAGPRRPRGGAGEGAGGAGRPGR